MLIDIRAALLKNVVDAESSTLTDLKELLDSKDFKVYFITSN